MAEEKSATYGMAIDLAKCIGCHACTVACKKEHEIVFGGYNTWVEDWDVGSYPDVTRAHLPKLCNHCEDAPCIPVCPVGATFYEYGGAVVIDIEKCIGCGACVSACPYGARFMDDEAKKAGKCNFCFDRAVAGMQPECVSTCVTHARVFGDLNDPESDVAKLFESGGAETLAEEKIGLTVHVKYIGLNDTVKEPVSSMVFRGGNKAEPKYENA